VHASTRDFAAKNDTLPRNIFASPGIPLGGGRRGWSNRG
jgi:hypothetical protein